MIEVNNQIITIGHFPDNTQLIKFDDKEIRNDLYGNHITIRWKYESDEECMTLYFLVKHLRNIPNYGKNVKIHLNMWYLPNARMDRVKNADEIFTLKYFADFINSLNFDSVELLDVHSDVGRGLINNVIESTDAVKEFVRRAINGIRIDANLEQIVPVLFFPDAGAMKRYEYLAKEYGQEGILYANKKREWRTGKILGLDIKTEFFDSSIEGRTILMVDDIISYGGTMKYSAEKLKELGAGKIYIYCTHLENSVLDKEKGTLLPLLENGTVEKIFTSHSLFSKSHPKIIEV